MLAPDLLARYAERAFLTPGRNRPTAREQAVLASGHRFSIPFAGGRLAAWSWGDGPTVYLVHGWGGSAARMTSFVGPLVRVGFSVVAFDAPGHGESDGRTSSVVEISRSLRAVAEWTAVADLVRGHPGAIGHSIGGAAIALAAHHGMVLKRAVFIGAPADLETPSREFAAREGLPPDVIQRMQRRVEARFGILWRDLAVPRLAPQAQLPLLVVHDTADTAVPFQDADTIARSWPGAERLTTTGLGHHRILHDGNVVQQAAEFLTGAGERAISLRQPGRVSVA
jgi:pimeloyl-ACP methyl ester carboxylesterase